MFSHNYPRILSTLRDADAVKSKMQLFYLSLQVKLEKKLKPPKKWSLLIRKVDWFTYDYKVFNLIIAIARWD